MIIPDLFEMRERWLNLGLFVHLLGLCNNIFKCMDSILRQILRIVSNGLLKRLLQVFDSELSLEILRLAGCERRQVCS